MPASIYPALCTSHVVYACFVTFAQVCTNDDLGSSFSRQLVPIRSVMAYEYDMKNEQQTAHEEGRKALHSSSSRDRAAAQID